MEQKLGFCTAADGVRICYSIIGEGPPIVKAPNWLTHLEFEWQSPVWSHWWEELAQNHTLVRFDQRGSGLSDRNIDGLTFDDCVSDLEAVVDCLGLDNFILLGMSQGGAFSVEYIARHPEKASKLILYGAYARGALKRGESAEEYNARLTMTNHWWGRDDPSYRQMFTSRFMPGATVEQASWFNELQRASTSPENAARVMVMPGESTYWTESPWSISRPWCCTAATTARYRLNRAANSHPSFQAPSSSLWKPRTTF